MANLYWPERPYKGLANYSEADRPLLAGRSSDIVGFIAKLLGGYTAILTLHGRTAVGKSSFLRAGVIPELKKRSPTYEVVSATFPVTSLLVRSTGDPLEKLAVSVYRFVQRFVEEWNRTDEKDEDESPHHYVELQRLLTDHPTEEDFRASVCASPRTFHKELARVARAVYGKLILFIDQGEEIVTLRSSNSSDAFRNYFEFLHWFCEKPIDAKICVLLRSEYKALFDDELFGRGIDRLRVASYHLGELSRKGMIEAILHPTKSEKPVGNESALEHYRFTFQDGLAEEIADQVIDASPAGGVLPTLQVICDRLYEYTYKARGEKAEAWSIRREDFLALGPPQEQILSHVKESIYEVLQDRRRDRELSFDPKLIDQSDGWLNVLTGFAEINADGRATTKTLTAPEVFELAARHKCSPEKIADVLAHLTQDSEYILAALGGTESEALYALMHDAVALVLSRWKREEFDVLRPREEVIKGNAVLRASSFTLEQLYSDAKGAFTQRPGRIRFETVDDTIWDHLLAIYAEHKGFSARLGFEFKLARSFDRPSPPDDARYQDFLNAHSIQPKLLVIPPVLFPMIRPPKWKTIGICNVFWGYALIGKPNGDLAQQSLETITDTILNQGKRVAVFEERCRDFYKLIGEVVGRQLPEPELVPDDSGSDVLYLELVSGRADFIVGSAPTRARCEQAGFRVYSTVDDLLKLAQAKSAKNHVQKIKELLMHEVWTIDRGSGEELKPETLLRLGSVLFYTVQYILNDPEDFVKFVHYQMQTKAPEGTIPVDLAWVRKAMAACYQFAEFDDYLYNYLLPGSDRHFLTGLPEESKPEEVIRDASSVHDRLARLRCICDDHLIKLRDSLPVTAAGQGEELEKQIVDLLTIGKRHYQIYNFYDAERFLRKAVSLIGEMHK
jgi:hypothetical protein